MSRSRRADSGRPLRSLAAIRRREASKRARQGRVRSTNREGSSLVPRRARAGDTESVARGSGFERRSSRSFRDKERNERDKERNERDKPRGESHFVAKRATQGETFRSFVGSRATFAPRLRSIFRKRGSIGQSCGREGEERARQTKLRGSIVLIVPSIGRILRSIVGAA